MSTPASRDPEGSSPARIPAESVLPPVQPPTGTFVLQLFVIPLLIVAIICGLWFTFSWFANAGARPEEVIRGLELLNEDSWRKAMMLADLLNSAEYDSLKDDTSVAGRLGELLTDEVKKGSKAAMRVKLRIYLCQALSRFRVSSVVEPLAFAAETETNPEDLEVRRSALSALARFAGERVQRQNLAGISELAEHEHLRAALLKATQEFGDDHVVETAGGNDRQTLTDRDLRQRLRSTAAFTLGVIGGPENLNALAQLLKDPAANVRFNAATGLAQHGDARCEGTLLEMLDLNNTDALEGEASEEGKTWKRNEVVRIGLKAANDLAAKNPDHSLKTLIEAAESLANRLRDEGGHGALQLDAQEAALKLKKREAGRTAGA